jgi:hypothetical protein
MAIIYSYPQAIPKGSDLIIGTVTYDPDDPAPVRGNPTRSFKVSDLAGSIKGNSYTLTSKASGANSAIVLTDNTGFISGLVNFNSGSGMSVLDGGNTITITNTGVLSTIAGTGISLNNTTGNVTITNSGVTSFNVVDSTYINLTSTAATGSVTLSAELNATGTPSDLNFLRGDNVWAIPAGGGTVTSVNAGADIAVDNTDPDNPIISNTAPDQTVVLTGAGGTTITGTYPAFTITSTDAAGVEAIVAGTAISVDSTDPANPIVTNTLPDQTVVLTGSGGATVTGTYPTFNIDSAPGGVTSLIAGTGISLTDSTGDITITNSAPDQTVSISGSGGTSVSGAYPTFTVSSPQIPSLDGYVRGSGTPGQLTLWDSSGNTITNAPIVVSANNELNLGALNNATSNSQMTALIHSTRIYNRLYVGSTGGSGAVDSVLISTGATTDGVDGLDWSPVTDYLKRQTTDISTFDSVDDDITLGGVGSSNTVLASQLAIKTYIDNNAAGGIIYQGGYDATTNTPDLTTSPNSILKSWMYTVTVDGTFYGETLRVGDVLISNIDNPTSLADWTTVQSNIDLATAGTVVTATPGIASFNEESFTVTNGFVSLNTSTSATITASGPVTHSFNTRDVIVQLYDTVTFETIYADVVRTSTTQVTVNFGVTPTNPVRVLITKAN